MDGFRKSLENEFSSIWVFNLRGNQRTSGEKSRQEGGKIFGSGSRTPVAITIIVRKQRHKGKAKIHYQDIGDYLNREEKLTIIETQHSITNGEWETITPDGSGDWVNQRDEKYGSYQVLGDKKDKSATPIFDTYSLGVVTNRDAWMINSSESELAFNAERMIDEYNRLNSEFGQWCVSNGRPRDEQTMEDFASLNNDESKISWTRGLKADLRKGKSAEFDKSKIVTTMYRPFFKQKLYFDRQLNEMVLQIPKLFPNPSAENIVISMNVGDVRKPFGPIITSVVPNLALSDPGQCFPLYVYEEPPEDVSLFDTNETDGLSRRDAITDFTHARYRKQYGNEVAKEDIFYFVYGLLNSREYIHRYQADLSKMMPRIPLVKDFWGFSTAGRNLAEWHLNYETVEPWELDGLPPAKASAASFRVEKMKFAKSAGDHSKSTIIVNSQYTLAGIPEDAYRYTVNGKSAIEWLIDRYQVKTDKASGILNDPNLYSDDPRYIIDLVARIVRVSMESVAIIDSLPKLEIID
jgi:predicted helicase